MEKINEKVREVRKNEERLDEFMVNQERTLFDSLVRYFESGIKNEE